MNIKITIKKLTFERPKENPKNTKLELNLNWSVEYKKIDTNSLNYTCRLKTKNEFPMVFTIEGIIEFENEIINIPEDISKCILNNMTQILVHMINLTKEKPIKLETPQVAEIPTQKIAS
ncbi:hypothetical protein [Methanotorris formicicus]|uniref:FlpE-related protein n=1 Tax=Methanotorris formicicus Mc-S-70 TaxID=647171 RepID=H1KZN4_9EURY|nr:hypothetical protein [Methanotorris formicicus]EHP85775.1 FlpE-related protein [Methanotorris formicicus Mc-S-70]